MIANAAPRWNSSAVSHDSAPLWASFPLLDYATNLPATVNILRFVVPPWD